MIDYRKRFDQIFVDLHQTKLFGDMANIKEDSPWHREDNILVHTQMVTAEYRACVNVDGTQPWSRQDFLGALAVAFHDVGKPPAMVIKNKPDRGDYKAFHGHEKVSARMWEDYAVEHFIRSGIVTPHEVWQVGWMIEHHVPWATKNDKKLELLARTAVDIGQHTFVNVLLADQRGRISDGQDLKLRDVETWLGTFNQICNTIQPLKQSPLQATMYMAIAPSGAGKSTFRATLGDDHQYFSLDALRLEWYDPTDYDNAWKLADRDSTFMSRAHHTYQNMITCNRDIFVDNVNASVKRRAFYINAAKQHGYKTVAVLFPTTLQTIYDRQLTRGDKCVAQHIVRSQYMNLQYPFVGEFDSIVVVDPYRELLK